MRHLVAAGGLAIAAWTCALVFSGAAGATGNDPFGWTPTSVMLTAPVGGTSAATITFTNNGSLPASIGQFSTKSPFDVQTNTCTSPTIPYKGTCSVTVDLAGTTPGQFADSLSFVWISGSQTGTDSVPLSGDVGGGVNCHCTKVSAAFENVHSTDFNREIVFYLRWELHCAVGSQSQCEGVIRLGHSTLHHGLHLYLGSERLGAGEISISCHAKPGAGCGPTITGEDENRFRLKGLPHSRAYETITFHLQVACTGFLGTFNGTEHLTLKFDAHGNLDRNESHLGKLS